MKPSIEKLRKYFRLEADQGYKNHAVIGGFSRMFDSWTSDARADGISEDIISAVSARLRDYHHLSETSRKEILQGLWKRITKDLEGKEQVPVKAPEVEVTEESQEDNEWVKEAEAVEPPEVRESPETEEKPKILPKLEVPDDGPVAALDAPITVLHGVGEKNAKTLERLGICSLGDLLYHFPRRYDDYSQLKPINRLKYKDEVTVIGTVQKASRRDIRGGKMKLVEAIITDGSGSLRATWFNQPWILKRLKVDSQVVLAGKIDQYLGRLTISNPELEHLDGKNLHTNRVVPVYPLTKRITQRSLRFITDQVVSYWAPRVQDFLPDEIRESASLFDLPNALLQVHYPDSTEKLKQARQRLAFDEIFLLQMGVMKQKYLWEAQTANVFAISDEILQSRLEKLPFTLTGAQQRSFEDVRKDLASGRPMNRLIQGDVGSGKTVVAGLAIAMVAHFGAQSAIMAPTSILAEQHYQTLTNMLAVDNGLLQPEEIRLLIGATSNTEKQEINEGLAQGKIKVVVGTHAILEDPVTFSELELIVIDEQHRFGVKQRSKLRSKGENPHLLVMTATPIPRSLALTLYGDLDLSLIDELPPGRQEISTHILYPRERERAYQLIRKQVEDGHQAFIIYTLVEESEKSEDKAAVEEHQRLQSDIFPDLRLGLLHGRLRPQEKEEVIGAFRDGSYDILVSTSVVEVGVDIPNATVMVIEGANRFGLAQLHQFRGRVGRSETKSYCLLIPQHPDAVENERLKAMAESNDGFILAEKDLAQRGPGDFLGTQQSGYFELKMARITDVPLIEKARKHAQSMFEKDPDLSLPEHQLLLKAIDHYWVEGQGDIS